MMHQSENNFSPRSQMEMGSIAPKPIANTRCWRLFLIVSSAFYMLIGMVFLVVVRVVYHKNTDYTLFMETRAIDVSDVILVIAIITIITGLLGFSGAEKQRVKTLIVFNIVLVCTIVAEIIIVSIGYSHKDEIQEALMGYTIQAVKLFGPVGKTKFYCCGFQGLDHYRLQTELWVEIPDFCYSFLEYDNDAYGILKETRQCPPLFESYVNKGWPTFIVFVLIVITNVVVQVLNLIFAHKLINDLRRKEKLVKRSLLQLLGLTYALEKYAELRSNGSRRDPFLMDDTDVAPIRILEERSRAANENRRDHTPTVL